MLGDERIATFQSQMDDTPKTADDDKLIYHIADHLNSSSLDLSSTGVLIQATDYLPFGKSNTYEVTSKRVKGKKGGYTNKYKFANKQQDDETDLQYFEKRYYDNRIGRFTTEDPVYWEVGRTKRSDSYFTDPQQWNSYSYVRNNPINMVDPTGEAIDKTRPSTDTRPNGGGQTYFQAVNFTLQDGDDHYLSNNGTAIRVSFNEIDTSFITPRSFDVINNAINNGNPGTYTFEGGSAKQSFTTRTPKDYTIFGDLTFKTEGTLTISKDGGWSYDGVLKSYDDIYDFTVSHDDWTSLNPLRQGRNIQTIGLDLFKYGLKGTPFYIQITGEKPLQGASTPVPQVGQGSTNRGQSSVSSVSLPKAKSTGRANLSGGPLLK